MELPRVSAGISDSVPSRLAAVYAAMTASPKPLMQPCTTTFPRLLKPVWTAMGTARRVMAPKSGLSRRKSARFKRISGKRR